MDAADQELERYDIIGRVVERLSSLSLNDLKLVLRSLSENNLDILEAEYERKHDRKKCVITVDYATAGRAFSDYIQDISNSGAFINTKEPFSMGDEIVLVISFKGDQNPFKIPAKVVRQNDRGIGLRFNFQSQVQEAIINSFIGGIQTR
jgi:Tfp pilus assembly protein PilZ